jgi:branched-chain amino acid transport system substrate-binding protein
MLGTTRRLALTAGAASIAAAIALCCSLAVAADAVKVGLSMSLTGAVAPNGKQLLTALEIWRDDINKGAGLLGRPVELVYYDDQSNPATVPAIYTKLLNVDKVELLVGPYSTNAVAAAMPVLIAQNKTTISLLALDVNKQFRYPRYFSMIPVGPEGAIGFSKGFFELAAAQSPRPKTVAVIAADAEFAITSSDGARQNAKQFGFEIVYDRRYPPATADFGPIVRAVRAANPDMVFVAAYPPDTVGLIRAANEVGLNPKMLGGTLIGLLATPIKMQLGPLLNGILNNEIFVPSPKFDFPGLQDMLKRYQAKAAGQGIDPLGYGFAPFGYAAGQVLAQTVEATKTLDHDKLAAYMRSNTFQTVVGDVAFGPEGEWSTSRMVYSQFQNVIGNDIEQFRDTSRQVILLPAQYKTGEIIYPYENARRP